MPHNYFYAAAFISNVLDTNIVQPGRPGGKKSNRGMQNSEQFEQILEALPDITRSMRSMREILLANLIMLGEIPAPTFHEERRIDYLTDRFSESGLINTSVDEVGNGVGILEGAGDEEEYILVVAHADTVFSDKADHTLGVEPDRIVGPGVADNSLGLAVVASLPPLLERLDIELEKSLILMGATRSLGRGNLEGLSFFLENNKLPIRAGLCVEGVQLGRLSHLSIGMLRGEITCTVPESYNWTRFGDSSAILTMNEVINRLNDIPLPKRPRTSIVLGSIEGGSSYNVIAKNAKLKFEIRSESSDMVNDIGERIREAVAEVASRTGDEVVLDIFAEREPGGIPFSHPLAYNTRKIMESLNIKPRLAPSTSELSAFIDQQLPAITLGITGGDNLQEPDETIFIEPMYKGVTQLIGTLLAIDGGHCD